LAPTIDDVEAPSGSTGSLHLITKPFGCGVLMPQALGTDVPSRPPRIGVITGPALLHFHPLDPIAS
jgi:hypothetical protein